jgi:hypothetical protein
LHVGRARKSRQDTRNTAIYIGSGLRRVKPYAQSGIGIMWRVICPRGGSRRRGHDALKGLPRPPYIGWVLWVTSWFPSILLGHNMESLSELDYLVLYTKLSSCLWAHKSGRAGSTDRSAGLLVGQACLSGTVETLVGGDPWVPMSHKLPIDV